VLNGVPLVGGKSQPLDCQLFRAPSRRSDDRVLDNKGCHLLLVGRKAGGEELLRHLMKKEALECM
jgi:hypothetical protein